MLRKSKIKMEEFDWVKKKWVVQKDFLSGCEDFAEPVDLDDVAWQNDESTVVFRVWRCLFEAEWLCSFVRLFCSRPDEVGVLVVGDNLIVRMWWD